MSEAHSSLNTLPPIPDSNGLPRNTFLLKRTGGQAKYPAMDESISKALSLQTMEDDLVFERKDILTQAIVWMNLEDISLSEVSLSQKDEY